MTTARRPSMSPAAACRWKSGAASCATRIRACRSPRFRAPAAAVFAGLVRRQCTPARETDRGRAPPGADPVGQQSPTARSASLDGWLLNNLFGRRRISAWRRARAQPRVAIHNTSVAQPIAATPAANGQALVPSIADHRTDIAATLCCTKPSNGRPRRALRKWRHGAGDRLRQHHAEAGEIDRHRQNERRRPRSSRPDRHDHANPAGGNAQAAEAQNAVEPEAINNRAASVEPVM